MKTCAVIKLLEFAVVSHGFDFAFRQVSSCGMHFAGPSWTAIWTHAMLVCKAAAAFVQDIARPSTSSPLFIPSFAGWLNVLDSWMPNGADGLIVSGTGLNGVKVGLGFSVHGSGADTVRLTVDPGGAGMSFFIAVFLLARWVWQAVVGLL